MGHLSGNGLEPGREPRLARAAAGMILAVKVREHDFMREERRPFKGVGAVGVGAADKLVLAVGWRINLVLPNWRTTWLR
jgi:hypothetical protein